MKKLKCTRNLVMDPCFLAGKTYEVLSEDRNGYTLKNEQGEIHHFSKNGDEASIENWFEEAEE